MPDGTLIQERNIEKIPSIRRNPIIADMFQRLDFIERKGSGIRKIRMETSYLYGYTDEYAPKFESTQSSFHVILLNMNYNLHGFTTQVAVQDNRVIELLDFCIAPRTREEIQYHIGIQNREYFRKSILKPLLEANKIEMTIPEKPNSRNQKYVTVNHP
jgi:ATP-dependent DNA helicase RecG